MTHGFMNAPYNDTWIHGCTIQGHMDSWMHHTMTHVFMNAPYKDTWLHECTIQGHMDS